jgi:hypothetical protein
VDEPGASIKCGLRLTDVTVGWHRDEQNFSQQLTQRPLGALAGVKVQRDASITEEAFFPVMARSLQFLIRVIGAIRG